MAEQDGNSYCPYKHAKTRAHMLRRAYTFNVPRARVAGRAVAIFWSLFSPTFPYFSLSLSPSQNQKKSQISLNFNCLIDLRLDIKPVSADLIKLLFVW